MVCQRFDLGVAVGAGGNLDGSERAKADRGLERRHSGLGVDRVVDGELELLEDLPEHELAVVDIATGDLLDDAVDSFDSTVGSSVAARGGPVARTEEMMITSRSRPKGQLATTKMP